MPADHLFVNITTAKGRHLVEVEGELDYFSSAHLRRHLDGLDGRDIVLDLAAVSFVDAAAVGTMVSVDNRLNDDGHRLRVINLDRPHRRIFQIGRASHLLAPHLV